MTISKYVGNAFDKLSLPFIIKSLFKLEQLKNSEVEINEAKSGSLYMRGEWRFERKSSHEYLAIRVFTSSVSSEYTKIEKI